MNKFTFYYRRCWVIWCPEDVDSKALLHRVVAGVQTVEVFVTRNYWKQLYVKQLLFVFLNVLKSSLIAAWASISSGSFGLWKHATLAGLLGLLSTCVFFAWWVLEWLSTFLLSFAFTEWDWWACDDEICCVFSDLFFTFSNLAFPSKLSFSTF